MKLLKTPKTHFTILHDKFVYVCQNIVFFICIIFFTGACSKDNDVDTLKTKARLSINVDMEMKINESFIELKSTSNTQDFQVSLFKATGELVLSYERASALPSEIELDPGEYYVTSHSNNYAAAAFSNPYFEGRTENIILNANDFKTIHVKCVLANCAITIKYSDYIKQNFSDYITEVGIGSDKLLYGKDEIRLGFFDLQPINIKATLTYTLPNGSVYHKILSGVINNPEKGKLYETELDAGITEGYSVINIVLDESIEKQTVKIDDKNSDQILYGDLLITEIMYDPKALPDTDGEWFEVYNNSMKNINLKNIVISTTSANHTITSEIILSPGEYFLLARKDEAAEGPKYIYGTSITLTNTNGTIRLSTYGTDGTNGTEIAGVSYDNGSTFPRNANGASLSLNPLKFNADLAKSGSSWCLGSTVYNTGDYGTPGLPNKNCE